MTYAQGTPILGDTIVIRFLAVPKSGSVTPTPGEIVLSVCDVSFRGQLNTRPLQAVRVIEQMTPASANVPPGHPTTAERSLVARSAERPPNRVVARAAGALDPALTAL